MAEQATQTTIIAAPLDTVWSIATDIERNRVLADVVVPMWLEVAPGQAASDFATGQLLNFYVQSGATFTPVA